MAEETIFSKIIRREIPSDIVYQVTKNFSLQGNVNNLFDKTYDTNVEGSIVYGAPRNFSITGTYQF